MFFDVWSLSTCWKQSSRYANNNQKKKKRYPVAQAVMCDCSVCFPFSKIRQWCSAQEEGAALSMVLKPEACAAGDLPGWVWGAKPWAGRHIRNSSESVAYVDFCKSDMNKVQNCFCFFIFFFICLSLQRLKWKLVTS